MDRPDAPGLRCLYRRSPPLRTVRADRLLGEFVVRGELVEPQFSNASVDFAKALAIQVNKGLHVYERIFPWLAVAMIAALAATACGLGDDIPEQELRMQRLNKTVMCPVCPGESIDQSQNQLAAAMREIVATRVRDGQSDEQIKAYFVDKYDTWVLLEPPAEGFGLLVWLIPPAAATAAVVVLVLTLRVMRRSAARGADGPLSSTELSEEERSEYFRRLEGVLEYEGETSSDPSHGEPPAVAGQIEHVDG